MSDTKKIFIADDDPDILEILTLMLQTQGYEINTSLDANDIFKSNIQTPDLILLDIWMSGIDGRDIIKRLKQEDELKSVPVILISANSRLQEIAKEGQADDYITKPFEMEDLFKTIRSALHIEENQQDCG